MDYGLLEALFGAYFEVRKGKRNTVNQLRFELELESLLVGLADDIRNRRYTPSRSICFMIDELGVKREIFGANFRDRIVHRLIFDQIAPLFEPSFIDDSYSCRKGKGTLYAVRRLDHHIRSCSLNYKRPCWVLKLDIRGYFFAIDRMILDQMVCGKIRREWAAFCRRQPRSRYMLDEETLLYLVRTVIFDEATKNCIVRGTSAQWEAFPASKSLFHAPEGCGLPIGNLTSQLFSNIYMNRFDQFVKRVLKIRHYGRYVDDFFLVHEDPGVLRRLIPTLREFLSDELKLTLHPQKIYLQRADKGVLFVGAYVKNGRIYPGHRVVARFRQMLRSQNPETGGIRALRDVATRAAPAVHTVCSVRAEGNGGRAAGDTGAVWGACAGCPDDEAGRAGRAGEQTERTEQTEVRKLFFSVNSYLGCLKHFCCYRCRRKIIEANPWLFRYGWVTVDFTKFSAG